MNLFSKKIEGQKDFLSPWLDPLPFDWSEFESVGTEASYNKHHSIFDCDDPIEYVYLVKQGRVRLYLLSDLGEEKTIAIIGKNGLLGESSVFLDQEYYANAITASPTILIKIERTTFKNLILRSPVYSEQLFKLMNMKLRLLYQNTLHLSYSSSYNRVCQTLAQLGLTYGEPKDNGKIKIQVLFTHQELANLIGTTRVTVANHIKTLIEGDLISKPEKHYYIHDLALLMNHTAYKTDYTNNSE